MLLKPAVLKGSLATGFGVGAGPGVPGEPEKPKHVNSRSFRDSQKLCNKKVLCDKNLCDRNLCVTIVLCDKNICVTNLTLRKCLPPHSQRHHPQTLAMVVFSGKK